MKGSTKSFKVLSARLYDLLEAEAYSESTKKDMDFILRAMTGYMEANGIEEYTPEIGKQLVAYCADELHVCYSRVSRAENIARKLNQLLIGLDGRDALLPNLTKRPDLSCGLLVPLKEYIANCIEEGNRQTTIDYKRWICGRFLKELSDLGCTEMRDVTGECVQAAFLALGFMRYWERIGPFLHFLFESGYLELDYSKLIQHRHSPRPQPTVYLPEEISAVEDSFDLSTPNGVRNYAITLLMTRYGIRACDVAAMTFDSIDFENNRLHFTQQKTGEFWEAELLSEVAAALQNYIQVARRNIPECRRVFITLQPPYAPIDYRIIDTMVGSQFGHAKIDIAGRRHGSRAFRSSIASNMVNDGISTEVVRKVLGHGTKHAIRHYARIDIESMRLCPLPVPQPTGIFAEILSGKGVRLHV